MKILEPSFTALLGKGSQATNASILPSFICSSMSGGESFTTFTELVVQPERRSVRVITTGITGIITGIATFVTGIENLLAIFLAIFDIIITWIKPVRLTGLKINGGL
jgi:hypothetical protein